MAAAFVAGYLLLGLITAIVVTGIADAAGDDDAIVVGLLAGLIFPITILIFIVALGGEAVSKTLKSWEEEEKEEKNKEDTARYE